MPHQAIENIRRRLLKLNQGIFDFWLKNGIDPVYGGVYGYHDKGGLPDPMADKGLIQQARSLWSYSAYYENRTRSPEAQAAAYSIKDFLLNNFHPGKNGLYPFKVTKDGSKIIDAAEQYYANSFFIYAFAEFGRIFNDPHAITLAMDLFNAIVSQPYTETRGGLDPVYGGFDQSGDPWYFSSPDVKKAMSPHLHLLESFAALFKATGDPKVGSVLNHLLDVFLEKMIADRSFIPAEYLRDFRPYGTLTVKYGYQMIALWILYDASQLLGRDQNPVLRDKLVRVGEQVVQQGFDGKLGGFFEEGTTDGVLIKTNKVWWVQAEGMMGLWTLFELSKDPRYLEKIEKTLRWIENYQVNPQTNEWWWEVIGVTPSLSFPFTSNEWKDSYHHGRATMLLPLRMPPDVSLFRCLSDTAQDSLSLAREF